MKEMFNILLVSAITSCASTPAVQTTSVCEIMHSKDSYLGKVVQFTATYDTDFRHYSFFKDESCSDGNLLNLGRFAGNVEYENLEKSWLDGCERDGSQGLCVIEEQVDVTGAIRRSGDGSIVLDVINIKPNSRRRLKTKGGGGN